MWCRVLSHMHELNVLERTAIESDSLVSEDVTEIACKRVAQLEYVERIRGH